MVIKEFFIKNVRFLILFCGVSFISNLVTTNEDGKERQSKVEGKANKNRIPCEIHHLRDKNSIVMSLNELKQIKDHFNKLTKDIAENIVQYKKVVIQKEKEFQVGKNIDQLNELEFYQKKLNELETARKDAEVGVAAANNMLDRNIQLKENEKAVKEYARRTSSTSKEDPFYEPYRNFYRKIKEADNALTNVEYKHLKLQTAKADLEKAYEKHDRLISLIQEAEHLGDDGAFDEALQQIANKHEEPIIQEEEEKSQKYHKKLERFQNYAQEAKDAVQEAWQAYQKLPQFINVKLLEAPQETRNNNAVQQTNNNQLQLYQPLPALPFSAPTPHSVRQLDALQGVAYRTDNALAKKVVEQEYESMKAQKDYYDAYNAFKDIKEKCEDLLAGIERAKNQPRPELLPDDIEPAGIWKREELLEVPKGTFIDGSKIRQRYTYIPHNVDTRNNKFITAVIVHGTRGRATPAYFDDNNPEAQNFRHIKRFIAWYAAAHQQISELASFEWSGWLFNYRRKNAGESLARYLQLSHYHNADKILLLNHSHGCNVANYVTHLMPPEKPIELMIHWACPHRKEVYNQPAHCKQVLYFHSDADIITKLGRASMERDIVPLLATLSCPLVFFVAKPALSAGTYFVGYVANNLGLSTLLPSTLANVLSTIDSLIGTGVNISTMQLPVFLRNFRELYNRTNNLPPQHHKIIAGYRLMIDGKQPGHSEVTNVIKALPEIIALTHRKHFEELTRSSTFDLTVSGYGKDLNLELHTIQAGTTPPPLVTEYLVKVPKKELIEVLKCRCAQKRKVPHLYNDNNINDDVPELCKEHRMEEKFVPVHLPSVEHIPSTQLYVQDGASIIPIINNNHS